MNNNDIRNISKNFFGAILPDFMNLHQIIINKSSAQTFRSGLNYIKIQKNQLKKTKNRIFIV